MASTNIKYLKENNLFEAHKHFMRLSESYFGLPEDGIMQEDGEDDQQGGMPGGDPNAMGGAPGAAPGGMPGADPMGGGAPGAPGNDPMGGAGQPGQEMGADPNAMGQPMPDAGQSMVGPDTGEDPFADQREGDDEPGDGMIDGDTIDIDGLTKAQEKLDGKENHIGRDLAKVDSRIMNLIDKIENLQSALDSNNNELESLKAEFEKRNPTQTEKLDIRGALDSYPFNVRPDDFWTNKMKERNNYEVYGDNDNSTEDQYTITADDLDDMPSDINDSFSIDDDDIQTLEKIFKL